MFSKIKLLIKECEEYTRFAPNTSESLSFQRLEEAGSQLSKVRKHYEKEISDPTNLTQDFGTE